MNMGEEKGGNLGGAKEQRAARSDGSKRIRSGISARRATARKKRPKRTSSIILFLGAMAVVLGGAYVVANFVEGEIVQAMNRVHSSFDLRSVMTSVDGREVTLSGQVQDEATKQKVLFAAERATCETWLGDMACVASIEDRIAVVPRVRRQARDYDLSIHVREKVVTLRGAMQSEKAKKAFQNRMSLIRSEVVSELEVEEGRIRSGHREMLDVMVWLAEHLQNGDVSLRDGKLHTRGVYIGVDEKEVLSRLEATPQGFTIAKPEIISAAVLKVCQNNIDDVLSRSKVRFRSGLAELHPKSENVLGKLADVLSECPADVQIEGHTDNIGSPDGNRRLSERRAVVVSSWLADHGVARKRLVAKGFGSEKPVNSNEFGEGRAKNRRIEFRLLLKDEGN